MDPSVLGECYGISPDGKSRKDNAGLAQLTPSTDAQNDASIS
jgi:hypothetical protein